MLAAAPHVLLSFGADTFDSCRGLQLDFSEVGVAETGQRQRMGKRAAALSHTPAHTHTAASRAQKAKWVSSTVTNPKSL